MNVLVLYGEALLLLQSTFSALATVDVRIRDVVYTFFAFSTHSTTTTMAAIDGLLASEHNASFDEQINALSETNSNNDHL